jgi:TraX protein
MTRLILFGAISQIPYILLFDNLQLNIMFSFAVTTTTFECIRKFDRKIAILGIGLAGSQILNMNYGWYSVACPLMMISLKGKGNRLWWFGWIATNIIYTVTTGYWYQIFAALAPLILKYHDPKCDRKPNAIEKRFFYYFYPIHMAGLAALQATI